MDAAASGKGEENSAPRLAAAGSTVVGGVLTVRKCPLPVRLASRVFYSLSRTIEMLVTGWHGVHI